MKLIWLFICLLAVGVGAYEMKTVFLSELNPTCGNFNYYVQSNNEKTLTRNSHICGDYDIILSKSLRKIFKQYGFHHFQEYNEYCTAANQKTFIKDLPHRLDLYIWFNDYSSFERNGQIINIANCTKFYPIIDCLPVSDKDSFIKLNETLSQTKLHRASCISDWAVFLIVILGILLGIPILLIIFAGLCELILYLCWLILKSRTNNRAVDDNSNKSEVKDNSNKKSAVNDVSNKNSIEAKNNTTEAERKSKKSKSSKKQNGQYEVLTEVRLDIDESVDHLEAKINCTEEKVDKMSASFFGVVMK